MVKFALLVGINYKGTANELKGCINDVATIKQYLTTQRGYLPENIVTLTETDVSTLRPTGINILREFSRLILRGQGAEELFFHYSGHGSYIDDRDGDERDGRDETIVPLDYMNNGMITDDVMHDYVELMPAGCKLYCLFDCCHSGTILDLKYLYKGEAGAGVENSASRITGNVVMLSGCMDAQTSADAKIAGAWSGAMTQSFVSCVKPGITCTALLDGMRAYLKVGGYTQVPQLSSTSPVEREQVF